MVPFRDRIAGTHDRRSAGAGMDAAVGLGARLHRDVGGARDVPLHGEYGHGVPPLIVATLSIVVGWIAWRKRLPISA